MSKDKKKQDKDERSFGSSVGKGAVIGTGVGGGVGALGAGYYGKKAMNALTRYAASQGKKVSSKKKAAFIAASVLGGGALGALRGAETGTAIGGIAGAVRERKARKAAQQNN